MPACPHCGETVVADAAFCLRCGRELAAAPLATGAATGRPARPVGVAILAVLAWIGCAFSTLYGVMMLLGGEAFAQMMRSAGGVGAAESSMLKGVLATAGVVTLLFAVLYFFLGRGLWQGQNWTRVLYLVFSWIGVALYGLFAVVGLIAFDPVSMIMGVLGGGVSGFFVWYLTRPGVKAYFTRPEPAPAAAPGWG